MTLGLEYILVWLVSLLLVSTIVWLIVKSNFQNKSILKTEIEKQYISIDLHNNLEARYDILKDDFQDSQRLLEHSKIELASLQQELLFSKKTKNQYLEDLSKIKEQSKLQFESIANKIIEESRLKMSLDSQKHINETLNPLRTKIFEFEQNIAKRFTEEAKGLGALSQQIKQLTQLNHQLSSDAQNLTQALKGDSKVQGDWGELQLERLLEKSGLSKDIHFSVQLNIKSEDNKDKRPDFLIHLPNNKNLILDSKVSLKDYEVYHNTKNSTQQKSSAKKHLKSIQNHINNLTSKDYQLLYNINSPDYLLMFIPIEPALTLALQQDTNLFDYALERNVVLVSTSTLLATLRTVSFIWKQDNQKKYVMEIAHQSGLLYDKFVAFSEDLQLIGQRLNSTQAAYNNAMYKLKDGKRYNQTLVGRAEKIKNLGAKTSKKLPKEWIQDETKVEKNL